MFTPSRGGIPIILGVARNEGLGHPCASRGVVGGDIVVVRCYHNGLHFFPFAWEPDAVFGQPFSGAFQGVRGFGGEGDTIGEVAIRDVALLHLVAEFAQLLLGGLVLGYGSESHGYKSHQCECFFHY